MIVVERLKYVGICAGIEATIKNQMVRDACSASFVWLPLNLYLFPADYARPVPQAASVRDLPPT